MPGHSGVFSRNGLRIAPYWTLEDREHRESFEETAEQLRFLVKDSVRRQLVSDCPICVLMSGGLDSSIIAS
jgi:asparagine synthase (glutamine-hydrolysing)